MPSSEVLVHRTTPSTLVQDVDEVLSAAAPPGLDPGRRTVIKINGNFDFIYPGSNTSKWFLSAILRVLRDHGFGDVTVVEGDLPTFPAKQMIRRTRLIDVLDRYDVPFVPYERLERDAHELPRMLQEAQLVNLPVIHGHGIAIMSCASKNLFGLLPVDRRKYHATLSDKLLELVEWTSPMLTIVDGTVGLDGESTRRGNPRRADLIMAGWDPLAIDAVVSKIMGYTPDEIPLLALAMERGLLSEEVEVVGPFAESELPFIDFRFERSTVRRTAMALESTWLFNLTSFRWLEDRARRAFHYYSYWTKKRALFNGPWMEYESAMSNGDQSSDR